MGTSIWPSRAMRSSRSGRWFRYMPCSIVSMPSSIAISRAGHALAVRGDAVAHAVRLLDEHAHLVARELRGVGILELDRAGAGRHDLDEVGAVAHLLAHGLADLVGAVGLAVHAGEEAAAGRGRRDDPAAGQDARAVERPVAHRLARLDEQVVVAADVAERRDAHAQQLAEDLRDHVRRRPGPDLLGARLVGGLAEVAGAGRRVLVGVDQARHQRAPLDVDHARALGRRLAGARDRRDARRPRRAPTRARARARSCRRTRARSRTRCDPPPAAGR